MTIVIDSLWDCGRRRRHDSGTHRRPPNEVGAPRPVIPRTMGTRVSRQRKQPRRASGAGHGRDVGHRARGRTPAGPAPAQTSSFTAVTLLAAPKRSRRSPPPAARRASSLPTWATPRMFSASPTTSATSATSSTTRGSPSSLRPRSSKSLRSTECSRATCARRLSSWRRSLPAWPHEATAAS
jgi:hypothetical protein